MSGDIRVSSAGLDRIKKLEGFIPSAIQLSDGRWMIGYGHVRTARPGLRIGEREASALLEEDLRTSEATLAEVCRRPLNANEADALISFVFNITPGQFRQSEALRRLNAGDTAGVAAAMIEWRWARGSGGLEPVEPLLRRRYAEAALFLTPPDGPMGAPTPMFAPETDPAGAARGTPERASAALITHPAAHVDVAASVERMISGQPDADAKGQTFGESPEENEVAERLRRILQRSNQPFHDRVGQGSGNPLAQNGGQRILIDDLGVSEGIGRPVLTETGARPARHAPMVLIACSSLALLGVALMIHVGLIMASPGMVSVLLAVSGALGSASAYFLATRPGAREE